MYSGGKQGCVGDDKGLHRSTTCTMYPQHKRLGYEVYTRYFAEKVRKFLLCGGFATELITAKVRSRTSNISSAMCARRYEIFRLDVFCLADVESIEGLNYAHLNMCWGVTPPCVAQTCLGLRYYSTFD